ncbi:uncharacterized protein B9d2 isoform X1 [Dermacentor albipictus]|uniref:uncharacterized protein B9d2 isoform X1 n=1 Tax=Dermacentor albipictus TaxID=60249 RepID=UPI0038FC6899
MKSGANSTVSISEAGTGNTAGDEDDVAQHEAVTWRRLQAGVLRLKGIYFPSSWLSLHLRFGVIPHDSTCTTSKITRRRLDNGRTCCEDPLLLRPSSPGGGVIQLDRSITAPRVPVHKQRFEQRPRVNFHIGRSCAIAASYELYSNKRNQMAPFHPRWQGLVGITHLNAVQTDETKEWDTREPAIWQSAEPETTSKQNYDEEVAFPGVRKGTTGPSWRDSGKVKRKWTDTGTKTTGSFGAILWTFTSAPEASRTGRSCWSKCGTRTASGGTNSSATARATFPARQVSPR